jgi:hypothetical protein
MDTLMESVVFRAKKMTILSLIEDALLHHRMHDFHNAFANVLSVSI